MNQTEELFYRILVDPKVSLKVKKSIIKSFDKNNINSICELVLNVLNKNVPISQEVFKKLIPHAKNCRKILNRKLKIKEKKKIILTKGIQHGGFLQFIIPAILSTIGSIASTVIGNALTKKQDESETG
jgi:hypothetical protein